MSDLTKGPEGSTPLDLDELEGLRWLSKQKSPDILSESFVRKLHKQLLGNTQYQLENNFYQPKDLAARFHHTLVYIHLFPNGNGRHARIMADAVLTHLLDEPVLDWAGGYNLEKISPRRKQYIAALKQADKGEFKQLLEFVGT